MTSPHAELAPGSVISLPALENEKFVIGAVLKGGMGTVYQLVPVRPARSPLALKTYQETADRAQFVREAEIWISLGNHPNIAHALAYSEWRGRPTVIADWYDRSLAETDAKSRSPPNIVRFAVQLIEGLRYALDRAKVIHQDIKPSNVLVDSSDSPRLTDFGMARFAPETFPVPQNMDEVLPAMCHSVSLGAIGGTPLYMAPELFGGASPSVRTDIFSLGVTLYEMLTGQHPFVGPETCGRLRPVLRDAPLRAFERQGGSGIRPLVSLIVMALELNPEARPKSYADLLSRTSLRSVASPPRSYDVTDLVAQAAMLREQGRHEEALKLFHDSLERRPTNPVLLNSYAVLLLFQGRRDEAHNVLAMAVESLRQTAGRCGSALYLDPLANLAGQMINLNRFKEADDLLSEAWGWLEGEPSGALRDYPAFGWWFLYNGKFDLACKHILVMYKSKTPDQASLWWLTLAAWLSGAFAELATNLAACYLALDGVSLPNSA